MEPSATWIVILSSGYCSSTGRVLSVTRSGSTPEEALASATLALENREIEVDLHLMAKEPKDSIETNPILELIGQGQKVTRRR